MKQKRRRAGFTLVELMVVLAILVLLVAMVGPRLLGTQKKADIKATIQQIENLENCLNLYAVDNRTFPSTEDGLKSLLVRPAESTTSSETTQSSNWDGPYMDAEALPVDPWGNPYQYEFPPTKGSRKDFPNIWSLGPDGEDNTEDDIKNWKGDSDQEGNLDEEIDVIEEVPDEPTVPGTP
jgi:general secretion pathway protein G